MKRIRRKKMWRRIGIVVKTKGFIINIFEFGSDKILILNRLASFKSKVMKKKTTK